jgi:hypothetical protein
MNRTEDRLADALAAAARAVPEGTLRPLTSPSVRSRRALWFTPVAAALAIALVVGLVFAAGMLLTRSRPSGPPAGSQRPVPRYYVAEGLQGGRPVVRATATGKITGTVPVPRSANLGVDDLVASGRGGQYFVVAAAPGIPGELLYRFRLTSTGQVTSFAALPGGPLGNHDWNADAIAASPDGSRVAVSLSWAGPVCGSRPGESACPHFSTRPSYIDIIQVATGTRGVWRGGTSNAFTVASLSWTAHGRQLVYLGQSCAHFQPNSEMCASGVRTAQVRALNPAAPGGRLDSGPVLLDQSAALPYIAQAQISPDGTTITAVVLTGRKISSHGLSDLLPPHLSVIQVSRASGQPLRVLYQRYLGRTTRMNTDPDVLQLSQDSAGQHWMLSGGLCGGLHCQGAFNGWLRDGLLVPLPPVTGREADEAW